MGTDDSVYANRRSIDNTSCRLMAAGTATAMRTNQATKFLLLLVIITFLVYVLADQVPLAQREASPHQLRPAGPHAVSAQISVSAPTVKKYVGSEKVKNEKNEVSRSNKKREWIERNIENMCNHNVAGWGGKTVMHDILTYLSVLKKPITYLDVGANVGSTSLPALLCFRTRHKVIAVEPVKMNYEAIVKSKAGMSLTRTLDERFVVANVGLSDETKKANMWVPGVRGDNAALNEKASTVVFKDGLRQEEVQVYRGDEFLEMHKAEPRLIKIDVQGSEIRVLRGMEGYLKRQKELMIMAEHDYRLIENSGFGIYDVYDYMKRLGFKVYNKPNVTVKNDELSVDSDEIDREDVTKIRGDLVFWKCGSA